MTDNISSSGILALSRNVARSALIASRLVPVFIVSANALAALMIRIQVIASCRGLNDPNIKSGVFMSRTMPAQESSGQLFGKTGWLPAEDARGSEGAYEHCKQSRIVPRRAGIYIASKAKHGARWQALRASGVPIVSTWIDESGEGQTSDWGDLWARSVREASTAAAFVMYVEPGETHRGSLVEIGAAILSGVPVFWVGPAVGSVCRARNVTICETIEEAVGRAIGCSVHQDTMRDPDIRSLIRNDKQGVK